MKGFLVLLVVAAAALGGILYWRRLIQAPHAPVTAASAPARAAKEHRHRRRRGARRVARNDVFVASAPSDAPPDYEASPREAPRADERAIPGAAEATDPADDVFGTAANGPAPSTSPVGGKQAVAIAEPAPRKLSTADLRAVAQGEDLSKPEVTRLDLSDATPELSQDEIDTRFHAKEDAVLGCIARARPDEYTWIPGRVVVTFRILRAGAVKGVRVEAPAILQRGGLYGCVKGVVGGMKFPAGTTNQVVTYPFSLT
ncbi:MAG TPA: hypothetical protein VK989_11320 [Polyangia bacterium]|nr:hypothetical protein [Polyangia bacterium]